MTQTLAAPLAPFADALPVPRRLVAAEQNGRLSVPIRAGAHRFHRDLPESVIWGYDGTVPGPTIEAERGQPVTVQWRNELDGALPVVVTTAPVAADTSGVPVQCVPGLSGGMPDQNAAALAGHTVVHLHGGLTPASYDGWAENLFAPGQDAVFHYPMDQRAALLWYHDHVMGVTRFGVYAGLAGLWIIRDQRERQLGLPEGPPFEVPLLIQDRNFGLDDSGRLTGQLVHKTDPEVMEAFPPFTVVNGKVWPLLEVQPATYRFRVLNGSNARTYRLVLLRDGEPELRRITQIGTDHGLLRTPARVPPDGLVLASAERADLLVDFSGLEPGSELTLVNTARRQRPGRGRSRPNAAVSARHELPRRPGPGDPSGDPRRACHRLPPPFTGRAGRCAAPHDRAHRARTRGRTQHAHMRELVIADDDHTGPVVTVTDDERTTRYRAAAAHFEDATTFFPVLDRYEIWQLINLTDDTHPIHVHLDPFQILSRRPIRYQIPDHGIEDLAITAAVTLERDPDDKLGHTIDDNERGLKDTVRVNPNEIAEIAVRFTTYSGRYMYHCHILEHEDRDMMRPIVIMPAELMPYMI
jgi:spore coat protein A